MNQRTAGNCWKCGASLGDVDYARESCCPRCGSYTHVCLNCRFHSPGRPNGCLEPVAEAVTDKRRANFCDYFEPGNPTPVESESSPEDLIRAAEDLFK